jgi:hypothetical protein
MIEFYYATLRGIHDALSIQTTWKNPQKTCIQIKFEKPWTWTEFEQARQVMIHMLDDISHPVTLIIDVRNAGFPPPNAIKPFKQVAEINHPDVRQIIFVAPRIIARFIESIMRLLTATFPNSNAAHKPQIVFKSTMEEAISFLERPTFAERGD